MNPSTTNPAFGSGWFPSGTSAATTNLSVPGSTQGTGIGGLGWGSNQNNPGSLGLAGARPLDAGGFTGQSIAQPSFAQGPLWPPTSGQTGISNTVQTSTPGFTVPGNHFGTASSLGSASGAPSGPWMTTTAPVGGLFGSTANGPSPWTTSAQSGSGASTLRQFSGMNPAAPAPAASSGPMNQGPGTSTVPSWVNFEDLPPALRTQLLEMERTCQQMDRFADRGIPDENHRINLGLQKHLGELNAQLTTLQAALSMTSADVADLKRTKDGGIRCMQHVCSLQEALITLQTEQESNEQDPFRGSQTDPRSRAPVLGSFATQSSWPTSPTESTAIMYRILRLPSTFMEAVTAMLEQRAARCGEKLRQITDLLAIHSDRRSQEWSARLQETEALEMSSEGNVAAYRGSSTAAAQRTSIQHAQNVLHNEHMLLMQVAGIVATLHDRLRALREWLTLLYQQRRPQAPLPWPSPQQMQPIRGFSSARV